MATVHGIMCSRHHLNDPQARFCSTCGVSMNQSSVIMVEGTRPALGVLVFHDGYRLIVDRSVVIGRTAETEIGTRNGAVRGVSLGDYAPFLSRKHATLTLDDWNVTLVDHGSTNGTYLCDAARRWRRLAPNRPYTLSPGTRLAFGRYIGVFQSSLRPHVA